jgi:hypothetical protein
VADDPSGSSVTDATPGGIPAPPSWRSWPVGIRVVVRRSLPEGGWTDVLGDLLEVGPDGVLVRTRRGPVHVPAADIALGKPVPPAPPRRPARLPTGDGATGDGTTGDGATGDRATGDRRRP